MKKKNKDTLYNEKFDNTDIRISNNPYGDIVYKNKDDMEELEWEEVPKDEFKSKYRNKRNNKIDLIIKSIIILLLIILLLIINF